MKLFFSTLCLMAGVRSIATAAPQVSGDTADANTVDRVEVSSLHDPDLRSYAQMRKGLLAYRDKHRLAPDSELYFILIPKSKNVDVRDVKMRLASDEASTDIPIDADGKFKLPLVEQKSDDEYDLILNKPKGLFKIKPYVKSAHLPDNVKRLGDLRLECEVRWAVERQDVSAVFLTYVKLLASGNPCTSRFVAVGYLAPLGTDTVTLDSPKKKIALKVRDFQNYSLPIWDQSLSDDDEVRYARAQ